MPGEAKWIHPQLKYMSAKDFLDWMVACSAILPVLELLETAAQIGLAEAEFEAGVLRQRWGWQLECSHAEYSKRGNIWQYPEDIGKEANAVEGELDKLLGTTEDMARVGWIRDLLTSRARKGDIVLDVGSNLGIYLFYWAQKVPHVNFIGLEPNSTEYEIAKRVFDRHPEWTNLLDFRYGSLGVQPQDELYDVIMFNDVLEHVVYPGKLVQAATERLRHGGFICGSVPLNWPEDDIPDEQKCHLNQFTPHSLIRLFSGMETTVHIMQRAGTTQPTGFLLWLAQSAVGA